MDDRKLPGHDEFDRLMRKLVVVPKGEVDGEETKRQAVKKRRLARAKAKRDK